MLNLIALHTQRVLHLHILIQQTSDKSGEQSFLIELAQIHVEMLLRTKLILSKFSYLLGIKPS